MNPQRITALLGKELVQGPKNYFVIIALVMPVVFTLVVSLIFGTYFSGRSRLGIVDQGTSQITGFLQDNPALLVRNYSSATELQDAVSRGAVDMGVVLPGNFDSRIRANEQVNVTFYVWGESLLQNRIILGSALVNSMRQAVGQEPPVEITETVLGRGENIPWEKRLLPLMVLMSIILAGVMVPSSSLVNEKVKRTLTALSVSPATLGEILIAKGLLGLFISALSGLLMLFLNRAFGTQPLLLVGVMLLGAAFGTTIGLMIGMLVKDINTLFTVIKSLGIFLYAPGFIFMFPEIPQWIAQIFPTYYIIQPVLEISQNDATLAEIAPQIAILVGLLVLTILALGGLSRRAGETAAIRT
jgi:ABC-2 type transport system permease protein